LLDYVETIGADTSRIPEFDWQFAADAILARMAADIAIERHTGRREPYFASGGTIFMQVGKDLSEIPTLIGTGGIFTHNPFADRILTAGKGHHERAEILCPENPRILLDRDYVLYAIGLLADCYPDVALQIFEGHLWQVRESDLRVGRPVLAHVHDDCCGPG
jgi:uncharacterized protein (TIGR01319 family)